MLALCDELTTTVGFDGRVEYWEGAQNLRKINDIHCLYNEVQDSAILRRLWSVVVERLHYLCHVGFL
jgi:hypothetical protein